MRRVLGRTGILATAVLAALAVAGPALACGGLIGPNGAVNLLRTSTFAGYHNGVEHYVTSFTFAGGGGGAFGSLTPLPGVPTKVERGGDWTLQRLVQETQPVQQLARLSADSGVATTAGRAEVILKTRVDALDITVLKGGGAEVGRWAREHGFRLPPDAPEVLDFYARRSPIFLAASFDADAARKRGQQAGDGTPVHVTIPTTNPWVPLRILALGKQPAEPVEADVYLLTDRRPALLTAGRIGRLGQPDDTPAPVTVTHDQRASTELLADLRSDKGMKWLPAKGMWLTKVQVSGAAGSVTGDLAVDASGQRAPSRLAAGLPLRLAAARTDEETTGATPPWRGIAMLLAVLAGGVLLGRVAWRRGDESA